MLTAGSHWGVEFPVVPVLVSLLFFPRGCFLKTFFFDFDNNQGSRYSWQGDKSLDQVWQLLTTSRELERTNRGHKVKKKRRRGAEPMGRLKGLSCPSPNWEAGLGNTRIHTVAGLVCGTCTAWMWTCWTAHTRLNYRLRSHAEIKAISRSIKTQPESAEECATCDLICAHGGAAITKWFIVCVQWTQLCNSVIRWALQRRCFKWSLKKA